MSYFVQALFQNCWREHSAWTRSLQASLLPEGNMAGTVETFFTFQSFGTVAGASAAVMVVTNTYRRLRGSDSPWVAFISALIISFVGAYQANAWRGLGEVLLIVLNACLLFCTALGINETAAAGVASRPLTGVSPLGLRKVAWLSSWLSGVPK
jgi:hypothetical protein